MNISILKHKNEYIAFVSALVVGIFTHIYVMVNPLFNDDSIKMRNNGMYTGGAAQGRWFGEIFSKISEFFGYRITVPFFAYFICIIMLAVISMLLIRQFKIKNSIIAVLISSLIVTSTSIVQIFSYDYASIIIIFSLLLGTISAIVVCNIDIKNRNFKQTIIYSLIGIVLLILAIGTYQIAIPLFLTILLLNLIINYMFNDFNIIDIIKLGFIYIIISVLSLLLYLLLNRLVNYYIFGHQFVGGFAGMSAIGIPSYTISVLKNLFIRCIAVPFLLPFINYSGINTTFYSKMLVFLIYVFILLILVYYFRNKNIKEILFSLFLIVLLIISINFQRIMVTYTIQTRLTFTFVFIFIAPLILLDNIYFNEILNVKKIFFCLVSLLLLHLVFVANANYYTAHLKNLSIRNLTNQIVSKIINVEGYNDALPLVFIGGGNNSKNYSAIYYNDNYLSDQYIINPEYLFDGEARDSMFKVFANFQYKNPDILTIKDIGEIENKENVFYKIGHYGYTYSTNREIIAMPCYPNDGCVKIVDGVVVVKISN